MHSSHLRVGSVILEPLVALVVVMLGGLTVLTSMRELRNVSAAYRLRNDEMLAASALLDRVSLWPTSELNLRLGDRRQGPYTLRVTRARDNLYELSLMSPETGSMLLWTAVHRPVASEASDAR
jgi:hypothetical protein